MILAILDIVIPRHAQLRTTSSLDKALLQWATVHLPEIIEKHGSAWLEARRLEVMARESGSFPTMDEIAEHLHITRDEVEGACLRSLRAFDNPERDRERNNKARNKARQGEARIEKGAKPHSKSKARTKPWEALRMSRSSYYEKGLHKVPAADGKTAWTNSSDTVPSGRIRQIQSLNPTTGTNDSEDWRAFIQARRPAETVELPY